MKPIISCITNDVTKNDCANAILAVGGSPIMAHHPEEIKDVQAFSSALLLNLGATDDYDVMTTALSEAKRLGHPVVLDPVGVSGIAFRRSFCKKLIDMGGITCIRGNYNEIRAIIEDSDTSGGLDASPNEGNQKSLLADSMKAFAKNHRLTLVASGETDIVTDGDNTEFITSGSPWMTHITGTGCMASAVIAARLATTNTFDSICCAVETYGECGETAASDTESQNKGSGTFRVNFMDELSMANWD